MREYEYEGFAEYLESILTRASAATVAEPSEQRLYTLDQMREYVEACYQARTRLMRTDPTNSVLANLVNAVRWWGAQEDGIPAEVAPAFNAAHLALGWSLSHPMDFDAANKQADQQQDNPDTHGHEWNAEGERCLKCGDKDWFASSTCSGKAAQQQAESVLGLTNDRLTEDKAAHIMRRDGYTVTGYVLALEDGHRCVVEKSAVRWLSKDEMWNVMHPREDDQQAEPIPRHKPRKIVLDDERQAEPVGDEMDRSVLWYLNGELGRALSEAKAPNLSRLHVTALMELVNQALSAQSGQRAGVPDAVTETLKGIVAADWRKWDELSSPEEFVRWAKARANHALAIIAAAPTPAAQGGDGE